MRYNTTIRLLLLPTLLLALLALTAVARATGDDETDDSHDYDETARVARISYVSGDVNLRRAGSVQWERAALNCPLVEGDRLSTGAGARVEIQIDARNFVRLGADTTLDIVTLRPEGVALSLPDGTATLRLAHFDHDREYFEIDAPKTTVATEQTGLYRFDVAENGHVRVTVRAGGRARIYSDTSGFTLRAGRTAELSYDDSGEGDWNFTAANEPDSWDAWVSERERDLTARLHYDNRDRYYDQDVWGAEELDAYGDWVYTNDYGFVWRPSITIINHYDNWAPYRYGQWVWCPPYGWTWIGDEPWGWAPYHYGRWVFYDNYWCWAPRGYYHYHHRSWWRPALVAFVSLDLSFGSNICWYPLGYHQPDPRAHYYERLRHQHPGEFNNLHGLPPAYQHAVTNIPTREFIKGTMRGRPAPLELGDRALRNEPVRGPLPVRPSEPTNNGKPDKPTFADRTGGPPKGSATYRPLDRPTGAALRKPGAPLDQALRRGRIFNNRDPLVDKPAKSSNPERDAADRTTGVVTRPKGQTRVTDGAADGDNSAADSMHRARPIPSDEGNMRPRDPAVEHTERPAKHKDDGGGARAAPDTPRERSAQPAKHEERNETVVERPPKAERSEPPHERSEPSHERTEPHGERSTPAREERPHEERSTPHVEHSSPPPHEERSSPPPQHEEHSSPPREEHRSEPAREEKHSEPTRDHDSTPSKRPPL